MKRILLLGLTILAFSFRSQASADDASTTGKASYYGSNYTGRRTASGQIFNSDALTAAHRTMPFGARVRVTNLENNKTVVVRINDRGPFVDGRIISLTKRGARDLHYVKAGVAEVKIELVDAGTKN